jgi:hypothetical protein
LKRFLFALHAVGFLTANLVAPCVAAVKTVSTDGEATVYLGGDFSTSFDIAYKARLIPGPRNASWTTVSIMLIGRKIPGPAISVGLASAGRNGRGLSGFTLVTDPSMKYAYKSRPVRCGDGCVIELRGDAKRVEALVDGKPFGSWLRSSVPLLRPSVQLNAEAGRLGDSMRATLSTIRAVAGGVALAPPLCGFTTRGIAPTLSTTLEFAGTANGAPAAYVDLRSGARGDKCPAGT